MMMMMMMKKDDDYVDEMMMIWSTDHNICRLTTYETDRSTGTATVDRKPGIMKSRSANERGQENSRLLILAVWES